MSDDPVLSYLARVEAMKPSPSLLGAMSELRAKRLEELPSPTGGWSSHSKMFVTSSRGQVLIRDCAGARLVYDPTFDPWVIAWDNGDLIVTVSVAGVPVANSNVRINYWMPRDAGPQDAP